MSPRSRKPRRPRRPEPPAEPDLLTGIREALGTGEPLALLELASSMLDLLDPRTGAEQPASRQELIDSFLDVVAPETSALLTALACLSGDDVLRRRVRRVVAERAHALPQWLADLHRTTPGERAVELVHVLGDGDNIAVAAVLPGGHPITALVYVDHNLGTVVKDAFVLPEPLDAVVAHYLEAAGGDPDLTARPLDPADARARVTEAGLDPDPSLTTDTWPACRPLVEWMTGLLPGGGAGWAEPQEWDDDGVAALVAQAHASPFFADVDDPAQLLTALVIFGVHHGDPLRWSPVVVDILLLDWIPDSIVADDAILAGVPDLLRAFIRFCHRERGVRQSLTDETIAAVDVLEPEYLQVLDATERPDPIRHLVGEAQRDLAVYLLDEVRTAVGGPETLDALDTDPLPVEEFDWDRVPPDVHERVGEVLGLVDEFCDARLTPELRTACRRLLADVAAGDPAIFRRRGKPANAAAAICWLIGKNNDLFTPAQLSVKELNSHFGVTGGAVSQRSEALLRAVGADPHASWHKHLGSPRYLTGAQRGALVEQRDRHLALR